MRILHILDHSLPLHSGYTFYAYEGLALLLDALPALRKQGPDIQVLLVGGGPQDRALKEQARARSLMGTLYLARATG